MNPRGLVILGSTGSIGRSTLDVVDRHPESFRVLALAARSSIEVLVEQYRKYRPRYICVVDPAQELALRNQIGNEKVEVLTGEADLVRLTTLPEADVVVNAVVGAAGLRASLETIKQNKILALANKESLVTGGPLFAPLLEQGKAKVFPIDSEHSAIWQAMMSGRREEVRQLLLTSSGGPFRNLPANRFGDITVEQALNHPTWKMGPKITIDSATLANKGLEVIEAVTLFGVSADLIKVVIHPQSIVHSMVEFIDSSVIAQMSMPDMRLPITYALFWPRRIESNFGKIDWTKPITITFEQPDLEKFPLLTTAFDVARTGGTAPAIFNAANEIAVEAFLNGTLRFTEIADIIRKTLDAVSMIGRPELEDILDADRVARRIAHERLERIAC